MSPVKLFGIPGLMIPEAEISKHELLTPNYENGYNRAIKIQGSKQIGHNRERLASLIYRESLRTVEQSDKLADAIIAQEESLLEVKE